MIFLDEPTSGLDSFTAYIIVKLLKDLTKKFKKTVVFTIHSPSSDIFNIFDRLLLLRQGETVFQV
jgi:ABC-type multidrug transport system ATPase subunit